MKSISLLPIEKPSALIEKSGVTSIVFFAKTVKMEDILRVCEVKGSVDGYLFD